MQGLQRNEPVTEAEASAPSTGALRPDPAGQRAALGSPENMDDLGAAPRAPKVIGETGLDILQLEQLALRLANLATAFTTDWLTRRLGLPLKLVNELCWDLRHEKMIEMQSELSPFNHRYAITQRGRDTAGRSLETTGYLGPAPVPIAQYVRCWKPRRRFARRCRKPWPRRRCGAWCCPPSQRR